jgi:hypothetical protein
MILQIATALALGIYVVLSKDAETPREPFPPSTVLPLNSANPPALGSNRDNIESAEPINWNALSRDLQASRGLNISV